MRVLFLSERYPPQRGGVAVSAARISAGLARHVEMTVLILTADLPPAVVDSQQHGALTLMRVGRPPQEDEALQLLETVALQGPEVDLVHGFYGGGVGHVAVSVACLMGRPSLLSLRGNDLERGFYRPKQSAQLAWALDKAHLVSCVSREQVGRLRAWYDRGGVFVANAVDADEFYPDEPWPDWEGQPVVVLSGETRLKKGLPLVLAALSEVPEARFVLLGGVRSEERPGLEAFRRAHPEPSSRLQELPYRRDVAWLRRVYARADLVWSPSLWDGMPNSLLEAMACARPVLATDVGGQRDLLADLDCTYPLREADRAPARIRQALARKEAPELRERVLQRHRPEQECQAFLELYRSLICSDE